MLRLTGIQRLGQRARKQSLERIAARQPARLLADDLPVDRLAGLQIGLRKADGGLRAAQPGTRLGNIGARGLANLEPVLRRLQLLLQKAHIGAPQFQQGLVAQDIHIGLCRTEQHVLDNAGQCLAARQDRRIRFQPGIARAKAAKHVLGDAQPDAAVDAVATGTASPARERLPRRRRHGA